MRYLGSKAASGAFQAIIAAMPPHDTYIETHLGSGAIMNRKPLAQQSWGIDIDPAVADRVKGKEDDCFNFVKADAVDFLKYGIDYTTAGRVLIYADPPYLPVTRTSRARYNFEYTVDDHKKLIGTLKDLVQQHGAMVMPSGYPSALYDELLPDWRTYEFQVMTRGGPRTEKLWMSFEEQGAHWVDHAGKNFTDRQRIKRKAARWAANYKALPAGEQLAVLAALLGADPA